MNGVTVVMARGGRLMVGDLQVVASHAQGL
jgi:hypothetical protein